MTQQRGGDQELIGLVLIAGITVAVGGGFVLDHVPWLLAWLILGVLAGAVIWLIAGGRVGPRVPLMIAGIAVVIAAVTWAGGFGPALNRDTQRQIRGRPAAAVLTHRPSHPHHARHVPRGHHAAAAQHRRHATSSRPTRSARFYGVRQLSRWRWARLFWPAAIVLGLPVALLAVAAVLAVGLATRQLRGRPKRAQTATPLRTAGRGRRG